MKKIGHIAIWVALALAILLALNQIEITVRCVVCKQPVFSESILCRLASRFSTHMHDYCSSEYEQAQKKTAGSE